ncbi:HlyD family secretion protein [Inquilinus sp. OTU3971]|uniref:HlyD family secretion protein n=1 Tax=Inquilinus sp. OTU3971 TaxID=3043855 RepID=UPI00313B01B0
MADDRASSHTSVPIKPALAQAPSKNPLRRTALVVVVIAVLLFALSVVMERLTPSSSQAVVQAYVVRMASEVAGRVLEIGVTDNARVAAGQVLFRIDPQPYEIAVSEAEAHLERIGQTLGASTQAVESAQAKLVSSQADRENVRAQVERARTLVERGVYARARLDEANAALGVSEATVTGAEADLAKAREELGPQGNDNPQFKEALAALERARLDLLHTTVLAPSDGVVTNLQLGVGQVVGTGQAALTFIDVGTIWVAAAYKENSLEYMAPGNVAEVVLDSLPGTVFAMRVESVGWGVSQDSVDPSTGLPDISNPSGWVREPQRFPVRLVFKDPPPRGIRYGSQVNVVIYTGKNPAMNAVGHVWIRLISVLTYVS